MATTIFLIKGMHCASCKNLIEEVTKEAAGVRDASVDALAATLVVSHDDHFDSGALVKSIEALGAGYELERI